MMAAVNFHKEIGTKLYWADMKSQAARAIGYIQSQRMALDVEVQRWKRFDPDAGEIDKIDEWADKFDLMEDEIQDFIAECDRLRIEADR